MIERMVQYEKDKFREEFSRRLRQALARNGVPEHGSGVFLQRITGVTPKAASKWLNAEAMPGAARIPAIAKELGVRAEWLHYGNGEVATEVAPESNVTSTPQPLHYYQYPVISEVQAGQFSECVVPYEPGTEDRHETSDYKAKGSAFWLEVTGDSMTAPAGMSPSIPEGTLVLVDTGLEATPGKLVVAQLDDSNEATFKKLISDGGQHYLQSLNPAYPLTRINGNCRIVGVAVEAKTRL